MTTTLKSLHILGACLFLGNIMVSGLWKTLADRNGTLLVARFATRLVNITDIVFTGLGAALLLASGHLMAGYYGGILRNDWMLWGYILFAISGMVWAAILVPIQVKQSRLLREATQDIPSEYYRLARIWAIAGTVATLAPLPAIYLMVAK